MAQLAQATYSRWTMKLLGKIIFTYRSSGNAVERRFGALVFAWTFIFRTAGFPAIPRQKLLEILLGL